MKLSAHQTVNEIFIKEWKSLLLKQQQTSNLDVEEPLKTWKNTYYTTIFQIDLIFTKAVKKVQPI